MSSLVTGKDFANPFFGGLRYILSVIYFVFNIYLGNITTGNAV